LAYNLWIIRRNHRFEERPSLIETLVKPKARKAPPPLRFTPPPREDDSSANFNPPPFGPALTRVYIIIQARRSFKYCSVEALNNLNYISSF
jgi:hypothetical protein